jgi:hypothetical protein
MKKLLIVSLFFIGSSLSHAGWYGGVTAVFGPVLGYGNVGAISYSALTGSFGWTRGFSTRWEAEFYANRYCGTAGCQAVAWFQNGCGALAVSGVNSGTYGWYLERDRFSAETGALRECSARGQACAIKGWACSY